MHHHLPRVAGLVAILAALLLAPAAQAASTSKSSRASAKERAYGKHCGPKSKQSRRAKSRAKCLDAMAKLANGSATSPRTACRGLSRKKVKGERKSAFARCVSEGARVLQAARRADHAADDAGDDEADDPGLDEADPADDADPSLDEGDADDLDPLADDSAAGDADDL
jgi:hypothetical protein